MDDKARGHAAFDPVTEADRAAEVAMRGMIRRDLPTHGILGEEFGSEKLDAECVWVLDPIDGTRAFIAGLPTWGTLIGLTHHGAAVRGLMHQPYLAEALLRGRRPRHPALPARDARPSTPGAARPSTRPSSPPRIPAVRGGRGARALPRPRAHGAALALRGRIATPIACWRRGQIDLVVEAGLKPTTSSR